MRGVIGRIKTVDNRLRPVDRKVAVKLHHRVRWIDQVRSVDLDFVVALRTGERCSKNNRHHGERENGTVHKAAT